MKDLNLLVWFTESEAAAYLRVSTTTIRKHRNTLRARRLCIGGEITRQGWRYHKAELDRLLMSPWIE